MTSANSAGISRGSMRWYWNRMRAMNPLELQHRASAALGGFSDRTLGRLMKAPAPSRRCTFPAPWLAAAGQLPPLDPLPYLQEADEIAAGRLPGLDGARFNLGLSADWKSASTTASRSPGLADIRLAMEPHRHGHLVRLAQAWRLSQDPRYLQALLQQLDSWLTQCVFPKGLAWCSALDAGLRLLNWSLVWQLLDGQHAGGTIPPALRDRWLANIYVHARYVRQHRSRHSSANNHLIGELTGLAAAAATWPVWPELVQWGISARRELLVEALKQTHEDGVGREQASWYQTFVFELLAVYVHLEHCQGRDVDERLRRRMAAMARFVAALRDHHGNLSHHGDADHAHALQLDLSSVNAYDRMLSLAADLDIAPELRGLAHTRSHTGAWLLNAPAPQNLPTATSPERVAVRQSLPRAFPHGGYHLLGRRFGEPNEILLTMDTGKLGYLSLAAHGHADALSLRLSVGGQPVLVDRGTYTYNAAPAWRHYFRSTLAHNTVCIDNTDQSHYGGPFLWLRHASGHLESFASADESGHIAAMHDGYLTLPHPLLHRRRVDWHGATSRFSVVDTLETQGPHTAAIAWHFDPKCEVTLRDGHAEVRLPGMSAQLRMAEPAHGGAWQLFTGPEHSMLGWHSPSFGQRTAAATLVWRTRITRTTTLTTWIDIQQHEGDQDAPGNSGLFR